MAILARDYLSLTATSCCEERHFSSAGRIATNARSGLVAKTIEQSVGSSAWMEMDLDMSGVWAEAQALVRKYKAK
jgi:hypothetical protein